LNRATRVGSKPCPQILDEGGRDLKMTNTLTYYDDSRAKFNVTGHDGEQIRFEKIDGMTLKTFYTGYL